jgi:phosphatidylglycerophosphatase A
VTLSRFLLWVAQGFGVGRIPFAPGTFGSVIGLGWFAALLACGNVFVFVAGTFLTIAISVWLSGLAERMLNQTDPGSVVVDEVCALPVCFLTSLCALWNRTGALPSPEFYFSKQGWLQTLVVFVLFRFFDVAKPWPVNRSQNLPGGWGVTIDDVLAAVYVNLIMLLLFAAGIF